MPKKVDSPIVKMKRNLRAKMRRGRGSAGATTISGMLQGMRQKSKSGLKRIGTKVNTGQQINAVKNKLTGLKNRKTLKGRKPQRVQRN